MNRNHYVTFASNLKDCSLRLVVRPVGKLGQEAAQLVLTEEETLDVVNAWKVSGSYLYQIYQRVKGRSLFKEITEHWQLWPTKGGVKPL
jgi:hypothetical protein